MRLYKNAVFLDCWEGVTPAHLPTEICCLKVECKPSVVTVDSTSRNGVAKQICFCFGLGH